MNTPATSHLTLPGPTISSPSSIPPDLVVPDNKDQTPPNTLQPTLRIWRSHVPTDIDIRSTSSHAQAEALVQGAQQSILDMQGVPDDRLSVGQSPLSAKPATYGESLAQERWLNLVEGRSGKILRGRG